VPRRWSKCNDANESVPLTDDRIRTSFPYRLVEDDKFARYAKCRALLCLTSPDSHTRNFEAGGNLSSNNSRAALYCSLPHPYAIIPGVQLSTTHSKMSHFFARFGDINEHSSAWYAL
jgi:hypothetical protein